MTAGPTAGRWPTDPRLEEPTFPGAAGCFVPLPAGTIEIPAEGLKLQTEARWLNADGTTSPVLPAALSAVDLDPEASA